MRVMLILHTAHPNVHSTKFLYLMYIMQFSRSVHSWACAYLQFTSQGGTLLLYS